MAESRELQQSRLILDEFSSMDAVTTQNDLQPNKPVQFVFVKKQINTTQVTGSNIENLGTSQHNPGLARAPRTDEEMNRNQAIIGDEKSEDCTWLSPKIVMFNKRRISHQPNSKVYRGRQALLNGRHRDVAVKLIHYSVKNVREIENLSKLNHPNIVQIYEAGEHHGLGHWIYIVMELCAMNLEEYVNMHPSDPTKAFLFFQQVIAAVAFMHEHNIAHRDIKPTNILISQCGNIIKVSDFGISKEIPHGLTSVTDTSHGAGSEGYKPPEAYFEDYKVSLKSDIFSLGIVLAYLFSHGKHPFGDKPFDWGYKIRNNVDSDLSRITTKLLPRQQLISLMRKMLCHQPRDRPTIHKIKEHCHNDKDRHMTDAKDETTDNEEEDRTCLQRLKQIRIEGEPAIIMFDSKSKHLYRFNHKTKTTTLMHNYRQLKPAMFSVASVGEYIYAFVCNFCVYKLKYSDVTATWEGMRGWILQHHGCNLPVVASSNAIFCPTGEFGRASRSVYKYDPSIDQWDKISDKPTATWGSALICTDEFLYCIGGSDESYNYTSIVERMNLSTNRWERVANMNYGRPVDHVAVCGRNIYGVNDRLGDLHLEKYDPNVDQWTQMKSLSGHGNWKVQGIFGIDSSLFVVGHTRIAIYDIVEQEWRILKYSNRVTIQRAVLVDMMMCT